MLRDKLKKNVTRITGPLLLLNSVAKKYKSSLTRKCYVGLNDFFGIPIQLWLSKYPS